MRHVLIGRCANVFPFATIAAAATVVIKSNSKDYENADLSALEFDSSTTETLADLENPIQS